MNAVLALLASFVVLAESAWAHDPYVTDRVPWQAPDGTRYSIAMLYGDGIFGPDPGRPVVIDGKGDVVALGPIGRDGYVHCRIETDCTVILAVGAVVPNVSTFRAGRPPNFYPDWVKEDYGFRSVALTAQDHWVKWTIPFRRGPIVMSVFTLIFLPLGVLCGSMLLPAWRFGRKLSWRVVGVVASILAWGAAVLVFGSIALLLIVLALWASGSVFILPAVSVTFAIAFVGGLMKACRGIVIDSNWQRKLPSTGNSF